LRAKGWSARGGGARGGGAQSARGASKGGPRAVQGQEMEPVAPRTAGQLCAAGPLALIQHLGFPARPWCSADPVGGHEGQSSGVGFGGLQHTLAGSDQDPEYEELSTIRLAAVPTQFCSGRSLLGGAVPRQSVAGVRPKRAFRVLSGSPRLHIHAQRTPGRWRTARPGAFPHLGPQARLWCSAGPPGRASMDSAPQGVGAQHAQGRLRTWDLRHVRGLQQVPQVAQVPAVRQALVKEGAGRVSPVPVGVGGGGMEGPGHRGSLRYEDDCGADSCTHTTRLRTATYAVAHAGAPHGHGSQGSKGLAHCMTTCVLRACAEPRSHVDKD